MGQTSLDVLLRIHLGIVRIGSWLATSSSVVFVSLVVLIAVCKSTIKVRTNDLFDTSLAFPTPVGPRSTNIVDVLLVRATGFSNPRFLVISFVALTGAAVLLAFMVKRFSGDAPLAGRMSLIFAMSWPLVLADLSWLGVANAGAPVFLVLFVLGRHWLPVTVGLVGWVLSHPELALAGAFSLLVLTFIPEFSYWRRRAAAAVFLAGTCTALGAIWLANAGVASRGGVLQENAVVSLTAFLRNGTLGVYSWWAFWWIVVVALLIGISGSSRTWLALALVVIPGLFTLITLDGTRVFSSVAAASGVVVITVAVRTMSDPCLPESQSASRRLPASHTYLGYLFLAFILFPNVQVQMPDDRIPLPGGFLVGLVENFASLQ